jgi:carboxymethylenebutenolidase
MADSHPEGFLALPAGGEGPAVMVLHPWWGLNETIKAFCTRLANAGFVVFAPDLYHGKVAETIAEAEALSSALFDIDHQAKAEVAQAALYLAERAGQPEKGMAVVGFSLGAYYALDLSATSPENIHSVVIFYGTGPADFSASRAEYLGHFAESDEYEPQANVEEMAAALSDAGRPIEFHHYPGTGHWFFEADRTDAFNAEAAKLAWERTLAFLQRPHAFGDRGA